MSESHDDVTDGDWDADLPAPAHTFTSAELDLAEALFGAMKRLRPNAHIQGDAEMGYTVVDGRFDLRLIARELLALNPSRR